MFSNGKTWFVENGEIILRLIPHFYLLNSVYSGTRIEYQVETIGKSKPVFDSKAGMVFADFSMTAMRPMHRQRTIWDFFNQA